MKIDELEIVELELKYCECCGGLWLRRKGDAKVYCATCAPYVAQFATPDARRSRVRFSLGKNVCMEREDGELPICGKGGNA